MSSLIADNIRSTCAPLGDRHSSVKLGFWRNKAASKVERERGNPDQK
ncbi:MULTISPECIES: hypothetical protein [unclassified Microcoleus]